MSSTLSKSISYNGDFDAAFEDSISDDGAFEDCATCDDGATLEDGNSDDGAFEDRALDLSVFCRLGAEVATVVAPSIAAAAPRGISGSQPRHTKSSSLKCNMGSQMTRPQSKCRNCLQPAQR